MNCYMFCWVVLINVLRVCLFFLVVDKVSVVMVLLLFVVVVMGINYSLVGLVSL